MDQPRRGRVVQNIGTFVVVVNSARLLRFDSADAGLASDPTRTDASGTTADAVMTPSPR